MALKWTERYNCHNAQIPRVGGLGVNWGGSREKSGYYISVFGNTLKQITQNVDEGKRLAVETAKDVLEDALDLLNDRL